MLDGGAINGRNVSEMNVRSHFVVGLLSQVGSSFSSVSYYSCIMCSPLSACIHLPSAGSCGGGSER